MSIPYTMTKKEIFGCVFYIVNATVGRFEVEVEIDADGGEPTEEQIQAAILEMAELEAEEERERFLP